MKHRKKGRKLNRNTKQRKALFRNLIGGLITHGEIKTTEAKAKAIKRLTDKLVSKAKKGSLHVRRQIMAFLPDKEVANRLVDVVAPLFSDRNSGFTRIVRIGRRRGDSAKIVKLELVKKPKKKEPKSQRAKEPKRASTSSGSKSKSKKSKSKSKKPKKSKKD